jgi:sialic acid synthase SpsE
LRKIPEIRDCFGVKVGFSDHTIGSSAAVGAVCYGATIIEKHFTLDHDLPGPDHWFSLNPKELNAYVKDIRFIEKSLGNSILIPTKKEMKMRKIARRSIVAKTKILAGEMITLKNIEFKRPGTGISPRFKKFVVGRLAGKNYKQGDLIE